jgi:hypothetical protein
MKRGATVSAAVLALAMAGCGKGEDPAEYAKQQAKSQEKPRPPSQIVKVTTPVAPGAKVKCEDWIDVAKFTEATGETEPLGINDKSRSEVDPTSICSLTKAGVPPSEAEQAKMMEKNTYKIGVVGGDEYCLVHLYCGHVTSNAEVERKCKSDAMNQMKDLMGQPACVHQTQRAARWAYRYTVVDTDTTCGLEVQGGPSVTDEDLVQRCTLAALESLTKQGIANPYLP